MKRLYIIVEGKTEFEFINELLCPFFSSIEIYQVTPLLLNTSKTQKGGDISYDRFKNNIEEKLYKENDIIITSLIDFFRLKTDFPRYTESLKINDKVERVTFLENAIADDIKSERFIPYIQLHEFEGLLFSDTKGFDYFSSINSKNKIILSEIIRNYPNPEMLNDGATTAPSKRLEQLILSYDKPFHGPIIALENTLVPIFAKCKRFKQWIEIFTQRLRYE